MGNIIKYSPLNYIQNIMDEGDNTTLWSILKGYNNIRVGFQYFDTTLDKPIW